MLVSSSQSSDSFLFSLKKNWDIQGQCSRERGEATTGEHNNLHKGGAGRAGEGGLLSPEEDPGQKYFVELNQKN